jgi:hypothetical protein
MANDNQFGFYRDVQLNNGALVVTGITGGGGSGTSGTSGAAGTSGTNGAAGSTGAAGTSGTSGTNGGAGTGPLGCTHFAYPLGTGLTYNLALTAQYQEMVISTDFQNRILAYPFVPGRNMNVKGINVQYTGLYGNTDARMKYLIYDNDDDNWLPKNKIIESTVITPEQSTIVQYSQDFTLSAGTTYWLAIAFNNGLSPTLNCRAYQPQGMLSIGTPNFVDGYGIMYKMAVSNTITFPTIPATWPRVTSGFGFYGSYVAEQGLWGGTATIPEVRFKT